MGGGIPKGKKKAGNIKTENLKKNRWLLDCPQVWNHRIGRDLRGYLGRPPAQWNIFDL